MTKTASTIFLDFGERCDLNSNKNRRSSFLPECLGNSAIIDENNRESENSFLVGLQTKHKPKFSQKPIIQEFCTGSKYYGEYNSLGIAGKGIYKFPHGVMYEGNFNKNGEFHGTGTLIYPSGQKVEGIWKNGKITEGSSCVTKENASYNPQQYCRMPDRRFEIEVLKDFNSAGQEYLTNQPNPPKQIPKGCYDAGEGFYDPKEKVIYDYKDPLAFRTLDDFGTKVEEEEFDEEIAHRPDDFKIKSHKGIVKNIREEKLYKKVNILSVPLRIKDEWIVKHCRREWDEPTGFRPDLYELWTSGQEKEDGASLKSNKEEDKIVDKLVELSIAGVTPTSYEGYSFIRIAESFVRPSQCPTPRQEKLSIAKKSPSLLAVSKMFLPNMANSEMVKNQLVKRICIYTAIKKVTAKLSSNIF